MRKRRIILYGTLSQRYGTGFATGRASVAAWGQAATLVNINTLAVGVQATGKVYVFMILMRIIVSEALILKSRLYVYA